MQTVKAFVVLTTLGRKAGAKVETFLIPSKYFCNFFTRKMQVFYNCLKIKRGKKIAFLAYSRQCYNGVTKSIKQPYYTFLDFA